MCPWYAYMWVHHVSIVYICMYVCVPMCLSVSVCAYMHVCLHIYFCVSTCVFMYVYVCMFMYACMGVYMVCVHAWVCVCLWVWGCAYIHLCVSVCVCVYHACMYWLEVIFICLSSGHILFWDRFLIWDLGLCRIGQLAQGSQESSFFCFPGTGITNVYPHTWLSTRVLNLELRSWDLSGQHLPTELSF